MVGENRGENSDGVWYKYAYFWNYRRFIQNLIGSRQKNKSESHNISTLSKNRKVLFLELVKFTTADTNSENCNKKEKAFWCLKLNLIHSLTQPVMNPVTNRIPSFFDNFLPKKHILGKCVMFGTRWMGLRSLYRGAVDRRTKRGDGRDSRERRRKACAVFCAFGKWEKLVMATPRFCTKAT